MDAHTANTRERSYRTSKRSKCNTSQSRKHTGIGKVVLGHGLSPEGIPRGVIKKTSINPGVKYLNDTTEDKCKSRYSPYPLKNKLNEINNILDVSQLYTSGQIRNGNSWIESQHVTSSTELKELEKQFESTIYTMLDTLQLDKSRLTPKEEYLLFSDKCQFHCHEIKNNPLDIEKPLSIFISHPASKSVSNSQTISSLASQHILDILPARRPLELLLTTKIYNKSISGPPSVDIGKLCSGIKSNIGLNPYGVLTDSKTIPSSITSESRCVIYHIDSISRYYVCLIFIDIVHLRNLDSDIDLGTRDVSEMNNEDSDEDSDDSSNISRIFYGKYSNPNSNRLDKISFQLPMTGYIEGKLLNYFYFKCNCVKAY